MARDGRGCNFIAYLVINKPRMMAMVRKGDACGWNHIVHLDLAS